MTAEHLNALVAAARAAENHECAAIADRLAREHPEAREVVTLVRDLILARRAR